MPIHEAKLNFKFQEIFMFDHLNSRIPKRIEQDKEKVSAVLILLIKKDGRYHILFEIRSNKLSTSLAKSVFLVAKEKRWKLPYRLPFVKHARNY